MEAFLKWFPTIVIVLMALQKFCTPEFPSPINWTPTQRATAAAIVGALLTAVQSVQGGTPWQQASLTGAMAIITAVVAHGQLGRRETPS